MDKSTNAEFIGPAFEAMKAEEATLKEELQQLQEQGTFLENELEIARTRRIESETRWNKVQDWIKEVTLKCEEEEKACKILEEKNKKTLADIENWKKRKQDQRKTYEDEVNKYVAAVEEICAQRCREADLYSEEGLLKNIEEMQLELTTMTEKLKKNEAELDKVNKEIEKLDREEEETSPEELSVPFEQRRIICKMVDEENIAAHRSLEARKREKKKLLEEWVNQYSR